MAIQKINLGTEPLGEGGDTNRSANTKINENFSNTEHAASRLVGTEVGNVAEMVSRRGVAGSGWGVTSVSHETDETLRPVNLKSGVYVLKDGGTLGPPSMGQYDRLCLVMKRHTANTGNAIWFPYGAGSKGTIVVERFFGDTREFFTLYSDKNTTKEEGTGYLVASSPVLKVQHDSFEKVHEAEQLDIEVKNIETGVYEITGTTGLREGDGWNLKPPKDVNGNVLCICEASESNGVITLKTYKKKFDFETVSIVADYEQPTDIPEGAVVMFRFNDLPQETLDEDYSV